MGRRRVGGCIGSGVDLSTQRSPSGLSGSPTSRSTGSPFMRRRGIVWQTSRLVDGGGIGNAGRVCAATSAGTIRIAATPMIRTLGPDSRREGRCNSGLIRGRIARRIASRKTPHAARVAEERRKGLA